MFVYSRMGNQYDLQNIQVLEKYFTYQHDIYTDVYYPTLGKNV
jgi:hypothetical protein